MRKTNRVSHEEMTERAKLFKPGQWVERKKQKEEGEWWDADEVVAVHRGLLTQVSWRFSKKKTRLETLARGLGRGDYRIIPRPTDEWIAEREKTLAGSRRSRYRDSDGQMWDVPTAYLRALVPLSTRERIEAAALASDQPFSKTVNDLLVLGLEGQALSEKERAALRLLRGHSADDLKAAADLVHGANGAGHG